MLLDSTHKVPLAWEYDRCLDVTDLDTLIFWNFAQLSILGSIIVAYKS